jgi:hypothetical protein
MSRRTAAEEAKFGHLNAAYEDAFRELALRVRDWQSLDGKSDLTETAIEDAKEKVEKALAAYRRSRDVLVEFILVSSETSESSALAPVHDDRVDQRARVEALAHQLWESAGRPAGRAEEDWYKAERLIRGRQCQPCV